MEVMTFLTGLFSESCSILFTMETFRRNIHCGLAMFSSEALRSACKVKRGVIIAGGSFQTMASYPCWILLETLRPAVVTL